MVNLKLQLKIAINTIIFLSHNPMAFVKPRQFVNIVAAVACCCGTYVVEMLTQIEIKTLHSRLANLNSLL